MIFTPESIEAILAGRKTVTRRPAVDWKRCYNRVGHTYPVQPGRGQKAVGRIHILRTDPESFVGESVVERCRSLPVDLLMWTREGEDEGFGTWHEFKREWLRLHPKDVYQDGMICAPCWRIEFELVEEASRDEN